MIESFKDSILKSRIDYYQRQLKYSRRKGEIKTFESNLLSGPNLKNCRLRSRRKRGASNMKRHGKLPF